MAAAADLVLRDPRARVLTLYPAKALIQDQLLKWQSLLGPLGVSFGYIDGDVPATERPKILRANPILLMTPDVVHAWLMARVGDPVVGDFLRNLRLLILDEAHVYDGVFGTNMAYFARRLRAASALQQCVSSTATIGQPGDFVQILTGLPAPVFGSDSDGSPAPPKTLLLGVRGWPPRPAASGSPRAGGFPAMVTFLKACADFEGGRFLAFGDSRPMVEQLVAALHREMRPEDDDNEDPSTGPATRDREGGKSRTGVGDTDSEQSGGSVWKRVLPYRSGYEDEDRKAIQAALTHGDLRGVVSTSALELGLDIGEIDLIVLLSIPPSVKSFWQRVGRGGRTEPGVCVVLDVDKLLEGPGLTRYLQREMEPNRLYLENRYLQFTNALCAAAELAQTGTDLETATPHFHPIPEGFLRFLSNELRPQEAVPADLTPLKQRAQGGPHVEFPLRTGIERNFRILGWAGTPLGSVTFSQALREAYPGAIYYYMAHPHRVVHFDFRKGEIQVRREKRYFTRPDLQRMAFPRFRGGLFRLWTQDAGFVAEVEMQVSERVSGFEELRGSVREKHDYGPGSQFFGRDLNRFFETTGVAWWFGSDRRLSVESAEFILRAFCIECGIQERDLGLGTFFTREAPGGSRECQGVCIYDASYGSLRLTQELGERFEAVVSAAVDAARADGAEPVVLRQLEEVRAAARVLVEKPVEEGARPALLREDDWAVVIARGEKGMFVKAEASEEVVVEDYRYTPKGLMYKLRHQAPGLSWLVEANRIMPLHGETRMIRLNLMTGEEAPA
jgi:DEAD/DEAH box helicase domain-containing protein